MRKVIYVAGSTQKLYQLTGECDRERNQLTLSRTASRFGVSGTDLGSSFEHNGRIYFLFGDTGPHQEDSIGYTTDTDPEAGIHLEFVTQANNPQQYLPPATVPPISLGAFEVPAGGFSANGKMYVFFTTDHFQDAGGDRMGRSVLAWSGDSAQTPFHLLYDFSNVHQGGKFINVSPVIVQNSTLPGLPDSVGGGLLVFGSGLYRASNPYLCYLPLSAVEDQAQRRYFAGRQAGSHKICWSTRESDAMALFTDPQIGEFSVTWNNFFQLWLILYNAESPRGINFRVAEHPWGPWSATALLLDPWLDQAYCHYMHASWDSRVCDYVHDPGMATGWGGEYGPYVVSRFTKGDSTRTTIYFVMSTWNPYNTVLMKSTLASSGDEAHPRIGGTPSFIQSQGSTKGNFEVVAPLEGGGLAHYWRNNDEQDLPWSAPTLFGTGSGQFDAVSLIQSNFGNPGNLELAARNGDRLVCFWRDSGPSFTWHGPYPVAAEGGGGSCGRQPVTGVTGNPVLIQGKFGAKGNFELIVPLAAGGLAHYFRDNDDLTLPWRAAPVFGQGARVIDSVTMIESNFGSPGTLEVIARTGDRLIYFWRDSTQPLAWHGPFPLVSDGVAVTGVSGNPVLIQLKGTKGNFELTVPLAGGGFAVYWRDNNDASLPWHGPVIAEPSTYFNTVSLIESNFGTPRNLEVVSRIGGQMAHSWRDSGPQFVWSGPFDFTSIS
jgi:hypothetical protein